MKELLIGVGAALMLAAGAFWWLAPAQHEAFALLKVSGKQQHVLGKADEGTEDYQTFKRTQVQLMLSPMVLRRAAAEPKIAKLATIQAHQDNPTAWLKEQLVIDYPDDAEVLRVSMKGTRPDDLIEIVNMVVKKYLTEVVQNERSKRVASQTELQKHFEDYQRDLAKQMEGLHQMEKVAKVGSTETAQIAKKLAVDKLQASMTLRDRIRTQLEDNAMQQKLLEAREEEGQRTTETKPAAPAAAPAALTAHQLAVQKKFLEERLLAAENDVNEQAEIVQNLESFSANVASKQAELSRLRNITNELGAELERSRIERLAMERITKVDDATLASTRGDAARRNGIAAILGLVGASLVLVGLVIPRRQAS